MLEMFMQNSSAEAVGPESFPTTFSIVCNMIFFIYTSTLVPRYIFGHEKEELETSKLENFNPTKKNASMPIGVNRGL